MVKSRLYQIAYIPKESRLSDFQKKLMGKDLKKVTSAMKKRDATKYAKSLRMEGYRDVEVFDAKAFTRR